MNVKPGDKVRMADLRRGRVFDVVVVEVRPDGKVVVEADRTQGPLRQWITGEGFLSPRETTA